MRTFDISTVKYFVSSVGGYSLSYALRHWKAKFPTFQHFYQDVISCSALESLAEFVRTVWDDIQPINITDALQERNIDRRRAMFDCIGVVKLFETLQPTMIDRQIITKERTRWDTNNRPYKMTYEDTYELYKIKYNKIFPEHWFVPRDDIFAVRCWCTTTQREYWIYVPQEAALGTAAPHFRELWNPDAIRAIAWTIRIDISQPKRIYRQGDIIVAEESPTSQIVEPYHLNKEQYLTLLYSET